MLQCLRLKVPVWGFRAAASHGFFNGVLALFGFTGLWVHSRSPKVGNSIASILKTNVWGIPALFGLNQVSNFMGFTVG